MNHSMQINKSLKGLKNGLKKRVVKRVVFAEKRVKNGYYY